MSHITEWSKEERCDDGTSKRTKVEKIKNGYLVCTTTDMKKEDGSWEYKTEKEYSETNPLESDNLSLLDKLEKIING